MIGIAKIAALAALGLVAYNVYGDKPKKEEEKAPPPPPPPPVVNTELRKIADTDVVVPFFKDQPKKDILAQAILSATYELAESWPTDYDSVVRAVPKDNPPKGERLFDWMVEEINKVGVGGGVTAMCIMADAKRGGDWTGTAPVALYAVYEPSVPAAAAKGLAVVLETQEISEIYAGADSGYSSEDLIQEFGLDK